MNKRIKCYFLDKIFSRTIFPDSAWYIHYKSLFQTFQSSVSVHYFKFLCHQKRLVTVDCTSGGEAQQSLLLNIITGAGNGSGTTARVSCEIMGELKQLRTIARSKSAFKSRGVRRSKDVFPALFAFIGQGGILNPPNHNGGVWVDFFRLTRVCRNFE